MGRSLFKALNSVLTGHQAKPTVFSMSIFSVVTTFTVTNESKGLEREIIIVVK